MMMRALEAGGIPPLTDRVRAPDDDNPRGYYEFERVKRLPDGDTGWLDDARGKAVKVIAALLEYLPSGYSYQVIFMHRRMPEILASQRKMLLRRGEDPDQISDETLERAFGKHVARATSWLARHPDFKSLDIDYHAMLDRPKTHVARVNTFLGGHLDELAMAGVVDPTLYRNRAEHS